LIKYSYECVDLKDVRNKHFVASSIKDLFDNIEAHKIIDNSLTIVMEQSFVWLSMPVI